MVSTVLFFVAGNFFRFLVTIQLASAVALMAYAIGVRRKVVKDSGACEMRRPDKSIEDGRIGVEMGNQGKLSMSTHQYSASN